MKRHRESGWAREGYKKKVKTASNIEESENALTHEEEK